MQNNWGATEGGNPSLYIWGKEGTQAIDLSPSNLSYPVSLGEKTVDAISWFIDYDYEYQAVPTGWDGTGSAKLTFTEGSYTNFIFRRSDFGTLTQSENLNLPENQTSPVNVYAVEKNKNNGKYVFDVFYSADDLLAHYKLPE